MGRGFYVKLGGSISRGTMSSQRCISGILLFPLNLPSGTRFRNVAFSFGRLPGVLLLCCGALGYSARADAEIIRFRMTGTVTVNDPTFILPADVVTGAPFTAQLTYDTSVPDSLPDDPSRGRYDFYQSEYEFGLSLSIGELLLQDDPAEESIRIQVFDNASPGIVAPSDFLIVSGVRFIGGPDLPDPYFLERIQFFWDNPNQDSWNTDALPSTLRPPAVGRAEVQVSRGDEQPPLGRPYTVIGNVTQVTVIPEPQTVSLLTVTGFIAVQIRCRRLSVERRGNRYAKSRHRNFQLNTQGGLQDGFPQGWASRLLVENLLCWE